MEDATLNTPSHIHNPSSRHAFSVISGSDRVALQTEGLSLPDSPHLSSNRTHPESDYGYRFARTQTVSPNAFLFWPGAVAGGRNGVKDTGSRPSDSAPP